MNLLLITHLLNGLFMVLLPILLAIYLTRKFRLGWRLWWIGAAVFVLSQVGHIPFNYFLTWLFQSGILPPISQTWRLPFNSVVLGLSAGIWEQTLNYVGFRWWAKEARSWGKGLLLGAGHGGSEAIILGVLVLLTFVNMVIVRNLDLSGLVPADQLALAEKQVLEYWSLPWYTTLLGALERFFAIIFHLSTTLMVLQVFLRGRLYWLWLAIGWHALMDGAVVYVAGIWGVYRAEIVVGILAMLSLGIIFALRQPEPSPSAEDHPAELANPMIISPIIEETPEKLEDSRFQDFGG